MKGRVVHRITTVRLVERQETRWTLNATLTRMTLDLLVRRVRPLATIKFGWKFIVLNIANPEVRRYFDLTPILYILY